MDLEGWSAMPKEVMQFCGFLPDLDTPGMLYRESILSDLLFNCHMMIPLSGVLAFLLLMTARVVSSMC